MLPETQIDAITEPRDPAMPVGQVTTRMVLIWCRITMSLRRLICLPFVNPFALNEVAIMLK